jgi:hypothetical protein
MALFWKAQSRPQPRTVYVPARAPQGRAPRVTTYCRSHPAPVAKVHVGDVLSHAGTPSAIYGCPVCNGREAWVFDFRTGRPRLLWRGKP